MNRLLFCVLLTSFAVARQAKNHHPFTVTPFAEPLVPCSENSECGHGYCDTGLCNCEYNWASFDSEEPCQYARYSRTKALLFQIYLGCFGVGISVLKWDGAIAMYWSFVVAAIIFNYLFEIWSQDDETAGKALLSTIVAWLCYIGAFVVYVMAVVYIAGSSCMDEHGVACGS